MIHHSILLVVLEIDKRNPEDQDRWNGCASRLRDRAKKNKDIQILGRNVVLISLQNELDLISEIVQEDILNLPYKYTIFDEKIEWHEVSKKV